MVQGGLIWSGPVAGFGALSEPSFRRKRQRDGRWRTELFAEGAAPGFCRTGVVTTSEGNAPRSNEGAAPRGRYLPTELATAITEVSGGRATLASCERDDRSRWPKGWRWTREGDEADRGSSSSGRGWGPPGSSSEIGAASCFAPSAVRGLLYCSTTTYRANKTRSTTSGGFFRDGRDLCCWELRSAGLPPQRKSLSKKARAAGAEEMADEEAPQRFARTVSKRPQRDAGTPARARPRCGRVRVEGASAPPAEKSAN